jgi:hypothetical protein
MFKKRWVVRLLGDQSATIYFCQEQRVGDRSSVAVSEEACLRCLTTERSKMKCNGQIGERAGACLPTHSFLRRPKLSITEFISDNFDFCAGVGLNWQLL